MGLTSQIFQKDRKIRIFGEFHYCHMFNILTKNNHFYNEQKKDFLHQHHKMYLLKPYNISQKKKNQKISMEMNKAK